MAKASADELRTIVREITPRLKAITESSSAAKASPGKWSKKEIIGHLIDSASNNHQRFVRAQLADSLAIPGYEQERWVTTQQYQVESWAELVSFWSAYNVHLAHVIAGVPQEKCGHKVQIGQSAPVTLEFLMTDYLRHLKHHLEQIFAE